MLMIWLYVINNLNKKYYKFMYIVSYIHFYNIYTIYMYIDI